MFKIVAISDTHGSSLRRLNLPKGDLLVHAGDLTSVGSIPQVSSAMFHLQEIAKNYTHGIIFIAGNHDTLFEEGAPLTKHLVPEGCQYLNDSGTVIEGISFWGSPVTPEFCDWAFNRKRGDEINQHWDLIPDNVDVLVTHGPPFGILDESPMTGGSVGCENLKEQILNRINPKVHIFGHIHDGNGEVKIQNTHFHNVSILNDNYKITYEPRIIIL